MKGCPCGECDRPPRSVDQVEWALHSGGVTQTLLWPPSSAAIVLEDPDQRPYVWDLPDG